MFLILLLLSLGIALLTSWLVSRYFDRAIDRILVSLVGAEVADAWHKYILFSLVVVGVSGGVQLFELQKYIPGKSDINPPPPASLMSTVLLLYGTVIETLQSIAWMMFLFFFCGLIAIVITRHLAARRAKHGE